MSIGSQAVEAVNQSKIAFCRFLTANDTGESGSHQAGIYMPKNTVPLLFDSPGIRGENKDRFVSITWNDDFTTKSRFIYYGEKTRNEYRITRMGKGFPYLKPDHTGDLFILSQSDIENYNGYVLEHEDDIDEFLGAFGMLPSDTGQLIDKRGINPEYQRQMLFDEYINGLTVDFPVSSEISEMARLITRKLNPQPGAMISEPDRILLEWIKTEYGLFQELENNKYSNVIYNGFENIEDFLKISLEIINRRKSRAGKSLEHHLSALFHGNLLKFEEQVRTEGNKKPDFIFPGGSEYRNQSYPSENLIFLGAKTTCKDRWRQILNEADRIPVKHLCTLQQGISPQQMSEMTEAGVKLVVPKPYIADYPKEYRTEIWTIAEFIGYVQEKQEA